MLKGKNTTAARAGFTLLEMANALVIMGLLVSGGIKGHAMIQSAMAHGVMKQTEELSAAALTFYDKYGVYPGDENQANIPPGDSTNRGNGNRRIEASERFELFEDLQQAGLINGPFDGSNDLPFHAFGDTVEIRWLNAAPSSLGPGHYFLFNNLPAEICQEIDLKYDDGNRSTGSITGSTAYEPESTVATLYIHFPAL